MSISIVGSMCFGASIEEPLCGDTHIIFIPFLSFQDQLDPFLLVEDELSILANRLRSMVVAEVPKLAFAAEYFFKMGVEGKGFRPTVLLLMATALNVHIPGPPDDVVVDALSEELRLRQQRIAEITEMIHVASLLHDDVLDDADTRRGIGSLNFVTGNKLAVLAGDFLLSRACVALASLKNTEVVSLLATVVEHLVTGETMQMTTASEQRCSMEYHMQKTYYKTASLISNSCKAITLLAGQTAEVSTLAYEYGKNLVCVISLIYIPTVIYYAPEDMVILTYSDSHRSTFSESPAGVDDRKCPPVVKLVSGQIMDETLVREFMNMYKEITMIGSHHRSLFRSVCLLIVEVKPHYLSDYYVRTLGIVTAPILFAMEEFPQLRAVVNRRFEDPAYVDLVTKHATLAAAAIDSLPESDDEDVRRSRRALVDLTQRVITRT
ncbi:hypothetical protein C3L33_09287, partial [Rhododendron williamsianum]